jgi:hypothetical protein
MPDCVDTHQQHRKAQQLGQCFIHNLYEVCLANAFHRPAASFTNGTMNSNSRFMGKSFGQNYPIFTYAYLNGMSRHK